MSSMSFEFIIHFRFHAHPNVNVVMNTKDLNLKLKLSSECALNVSFYLSLPINIFIQFLMTYRGVMFMTSTEQST